MPSDEPLVPCPDGATQPNQRPLRKLDDLLFRRPNHRNGWCSSELWDAIDERRATDDDQSSYDQDGSA